MDWAAIRRKEEREMWAVAWDGDDCRLQGGGWLQWVKKERRGRGQGNYWDLG